MHTGEYQACYIRECGDRGRLLASAGALVGSPRNPYWLQSYLEVVLRQRALARADHAPSSAANWQKQARRSNQAHENEGENKDNQSENKAAAYTSEVRSGHIHVCGRFQFANLRWC